MNPEVSYFALFTMGLLSSAHCIGMCGGIMGSLSLAIPASEKNKLVGISAAYNLGRIFSYSLIGLLFGLLTQSVDSITQANGFILALRLIAGCLLIATGLYISQWWLGLNQLEKFGSKLWIYLQPLSQSLLPVRNFRQGFLLGCVWGWLPCGLVYAALALAITRANAIESSLSMLAFGAGTLPTVFSAGVFSSFIMQPLKNFLQKKWVRSLVAVIFIVFGLWTIYFASAHSTHHHDHSMVEDSATDHATIDHSTMDHSNMNHEHMHH